MSFTGVLINKTNGNLARLPENKDRVIGLIAGGVATSELALNVAKRIISVKQAEDLGINAAYDANNDVVVYDHIVECFRLAPEAEVILMLTAQPTTSLAEWFDAEGIVEGFFRSTVTKDVKYLFTAFNPTGAFTPAFTNNGACDQVLLCITPAQELVNKFFAEQKYIDGIMLDGIAIDTVANLEDLRDTFDAPNISVNIAIDSYLKDNYDSQVAMGAAMGMFAARQINENLGSVEVLNPPALFKGRIIYPLDNGVRWAAAYVGNPTVGSSSLALTVLKDITTKGYIYAASFNGFEGFYFNGSPTAVGIESDYAFIENNCVWNKAARLVREGLLPKVRSVLKKDPATGYLTVTTAAALEQMGQKKLDTMVAANYCSSAKIKIDAQQAPSDQTPLIAQVQVVKDGILHKFDVDLGLFNNITI